MIDTASNPSGLLPRRVKKRDAAAAAWVLSSVTVLVVLVGVAAIRSSGNAPLVRPQGEDAPAASATLGPRDKSDAEHAILAQPAPFAPETVEPIGAPEPETAHRAPPFASRLN